MEALEKSTNGVVKDLRTIGVMTSARKVKVSEEDDENFSGDYFAVVGATVNENPRPGSDEIERAFDECWIGSNGYTLTDGKKQDHAIAFQGNVRNAEGDALTEVFVADIPQDITQVDGDKPLQGTLTTRPQFQRGDTAKNYVYKRSRNTWHSGPRFRLRTSPDGNVIYF